jgi:hypothetical protein
LANAFEGKPTMVSPISIIDSSLSSFIAFSTKHEGQLRFHQHAEVTGNGILNIKSKENFLFFTPKSNLHKKIALPDFPFIVYMILL